MDIVLTNIEKGYGDTGVIRGVSLSVERGEFLTLLGPSGCGKSTLLRIVAGLERDYSGSVWIGGKAVDHLRPKHRDLAMVFQSYALYPHLTAGENIAVPLAMRRLSGWERLPLLGRCLPAVRAKRDLIQQEVRDVARLLEIEPYLGRKPSQLSGGQRQRVAVARAMVRHPAVFLMDEPLSNLDAKLRVQMRSEITQLHRRLGVTFLYVTHDQAEAMTMSDRVAVMIEGNLLQVARPQDVYSSPDHVNVARFIGSPRINLMPATVARSGTIDVAGLRIPCTAEAPLGSSLIVGVRPEWFTPAEPGQDSISGRIRLVEHLGSDLFVHLDVPDVSEPVIARVQPERFAELEIGKTMRIGVPPQRVLLFKEDGYRLNAAKAQPALAAARH
jgi:multiple sugar transport system ATP-binding protein